MFDDLKIRNKLVLLVAGPLVIILLLAAFGAIDRQQTANESREVADLVSVARANNDVVDTLQREALSATYYVALKRQDADRAAVDEARAVTDQAMTVALERMKNNQDTSASFRSSSGLAIEAAAKLPYIRAAVDQGYTWDQTADVYHSLQNTFLNANDTIARTVGDPQVAGQLRTNSALASYKSAIAYQGSLLVGANAFTGDGTTESKTFGETGAYSLFEAATADVISQRAILNQLANATDKGVIRGATAGEELAFVEGAADQAILAGATERLDTNPYDISMATTGVITNLHKVENDLADRLIADAEANEATAGQAARFFLIAALVATVLAAAAAVLLGRRITRPLDNLTIAADRLANEQMPQLVEALKNPSEDEVTSQLSRMKSIEVSSKDEIGQLATAFNNVQKVAGEVAAEQAILLRKGIGEMFVNLARRNQALLDRQIEFIDELERTEEDPDQLENLYRLDHLATRMRRNAESLLVLAGAEPPRRRGRPAPLANVVRAALAEVEDFSRIELVSLDEVLVSSNAATDIAHLLSELMENATNFSPPETTVEVVGHRTKADGYVISVTDQGIGMSADQIAESNEMLARPPLVGLTLSRSLGFIVVGRLAARHGISVKMMPSPSGGATAVVSLPASLVTDGPGSSGLVSPSAAPAPAEPPHLQPVPEAKAESDGLPPLTFEPYDPVTTPVGHQEPAPAAAEPLDDPTPAVPAAGAGAPLSFARDQAIDESSAPSRAQARSEPTGDHVNGLPTRRLSASPAPTPRAARPAVTPEDPPAEQVPAEEPLVGNLDGPPPAAPKLPSRAATPRPPVPTATSAPEGDGTKPYFLEEAEPPRLFGRTPDQAPTPPDAPPRLFGGQAPPAAPEAPPVAAPSGGGVPPLARRESPAAPPVVDPAPDEDGEDRTETGLAKRTPRKAGGSRPIPGADGERGASATRRSPEEVRNLLSRYRDGQQRARDTDQVPVGPAEETESDE